MPPQKQTVVPSKSALSTALTLGFAVLVHASTASTASAQEAETRPLVFTAGQTFLFDNNIFRLNDAAAVPAAYGSTSRSDRISSTYGAISYDNTISKQEISARLDLNMLRYSAHAALNRNTYSALASWKGDIDRAWFAGANVGLSSTATDFFNQTGFSPNEVRGTQFGATLGYRFTPAWSAVSRLDLNNRVNSAAALSSADSRSTGFELGARYDAGAGLSGELVARRRQINFPNPQLIVQGGTTQAFSNSYHSNQLVARVNYQANGVSSFSGQFGLTRLGFDQLTQRNNSGYLLGLSYRYSHSDALNFNANLSRDVTNDVVSFSSPVTATNLAVEANWRPTGRITIKASQSFTQRKFNSDPNVVFGLSALDADRLSATSISARYEVMRTVFLNGGFTRQSRDAAVTGIAYSGNVISLGVELRLD
jgi:Putative beta-barrel porin 2